MSTPNMNRKLTRRRDFETPTLKRIKLNTSASPALEIPPSPCLRQLGYGTGVKVLLYERSPRSNGPRSPWAIKKLNKKYATRDIATRLEHEAKILKSLDHPNIIGYRGFKRNSDGSRILALETGKKCRSLFDVIEELRDSADENLEPFSPEKIAFVIKEVAKALHYLHTEKKILHGDLKAANVLVVGDFDNIKLCDFGVTLPLDQDGKADPSFQYVGTEPWSGKEVIDELEISAKTDVYALGCTIFEMLALDTPHADKMPPLDESVEQDDSATYESSEYDKAMGTRPNLPDYFDFDESYEKIMSIFYACTCEDPDQRPSPKKLVELLEDGKENLDKNQ